MISTASIALGIALGIVAVAIFIPAATLFVQCAAALFPPRRQSAPAIARPPLAVLVPAHNEQELLAATLQSIRPQLLAGDRLLVVADNCTDDTALVALDAGAEVIVRDQHELRGKGYALQCALDAFGPSPPAVVIIVDADCHVQPGALDAVARLVAASGRPVQAAYRMTAPPPRIADQVSALAVLIKNEVRPRGMARLGFPCMITGSGAAFPGELLVRVPFRGESLVEDVQQSVDLAVAGRPPLFCGAARLTSPLPARRAASRQQRLRWGHGHLHCLFRQSPRLFASALRQRRLDVLALALELCVPPLSLWMAAWAVVLTAGLGFGFAVGNWFAACVAGTSGILVACAIILAWARFGRHEFPLAAWLGVPAYVASKAMLYGEFLFRRQRGWVRTVRDHEALANPTGGRPTGARPTGCEPQPDSGLSAAAASRARASTGG